MFWACFLLLYCSISANNKNYFTFNPKVRSVRPKRLKWYPWMLCSKHTFFWYFSRSQQIIQNNLHLIQEYHQLEQNVLNDTNNCYVLSIKKHRENRKMLPRAAFCDSRDVFVKRLHIFLCEEVAWFFVWTGCVIFGVKKVSFCLKKVFGWNFFWHQRPGTVFYSLIKDQEEDWGRRS